MAARSGGSRRRVDPGRLPTQLITWLAIHISGENAAKGQYLWCLRDTVPGDRQIVWEGAGGRGLIAVVDFGVEARKTEAGRYERWGRFTPLKPPISPEAIVQHPLLSQRFCGAGAHGLQGLPIWLTAEQAAAIDELAGSLPRVSPPVDRPTRHDEAEIHWTNEQGLEPEKIIEDHIAGRRRLWKDLGFREPPVQQRRLPSGRRPDLLGAGVVADVKRRIRANDGPAQIERYVEELERTRPNERPWRGVLVHAQPDLDHAARERIQGSSIQASIDVWGLTRGRLGRRKLRKLL